MLSARVTQSLYTFILYTEQCPELPIILNGAIMYSHPNFDIGTLATHTCDPGFRLIGPQTRVCLLSATWSDQSPACQRKFIVIYIGSAWENKYHALWCRINSLRIKLLCQEPIMYLCLCICFNCI